jgi:hypothetical protein
MKKEQERKKREGRKKKERWGSKCGDLTPAHLAFYNKKDAG